MATARKLDGPTRWQLTSSTLADQVATAARGDAAEVALKAGLVTGIKSRLEVEREVIRLVGEDEYDEGSFSGVSRDEYVARRARGADSSSPDGTPKIGVVVASGEILDGDQPPGTIGGDSTARLIRKARMDEDVQAVVLRVDSPGGSMMAAEEIHREIVALKAARQAVRRVDGRSCGVRRLLHRRARG